MLDNNILIILLTNVNRHSVVKYSAITTRFVFLNNRPSKKLKSLVSAIKVKTNSISIIKSRVLIV